MIEPRFITLTEKKLIGLNVTMSLANNKTAQIWQSFGPRIKEIKNRITADKISMQVYPPLYHAQFNPQTAFTKWAAVEVADFENVPIGLKSFMLETGNYAVFDYKGSSANPAIFEYIYARWLPQSNYNLDNRPHFEVLGSKYKNNDPNSEEEIWIPVRKK